jgi:hypothetical protein
MKVWLRCWPHVLNFRSMSQKTRPMENKKAHRDTEGRLAVVREHLERLETATRDLLFEVQTSLQLLEADTGKRSRPIKTTPPGK